MISGHHFIPYASEVVGKIEREIQIVETLPELIAVLRETSVAHRFPRRIILSACDPVLSSPPGQ
jgi:hypothetical protein